MTLAIFIVLLLNAHLVQADPAGSALKRAYEAGRQEPNAAKRGKLYRDQLAEPIREKEEADKQKDKETAKRLVNNVRRAARSDPAKLDEVKKAVTERVKKGGVPAPSGNSKPTPVATATPAPGTYAPAVRPARVEQSSGPSAPAGYQGPVEGGGLSEVIDFNPQPMKTPTPTPSKKR